jgi:hypothetical protein
MPYEVRTCACHYISIRIGIHTYRVRLNWRIFQNTPYRLNTLNTAYFQNLKIKYIQIRIDTVYLFTGQYVFRNPPYRDRVNAALS